jgi:single-strand DNA-binding protein
MPGAGSVVSPEVRGTKGRTAMNETYVTIRGRLVADPTVRTTRTGAPMTVFRVATSSRNQVQGQPGVWEDGDTSYYQVKTFRALAANVAVSLRKGHPVTVHGKQQVTTFTKDDGTTWWDMEVVADAAGHDLTYGTAAFAKVGRPGEGDGLRQGPESPHHTDFTHQPEPGRPEEPDYVVVGGPGRGVGEVGHRDSGPLVPPDEEAAA